jgi:nucleotidyltransferase/DNA polymerase involved in DNA repair
VSSCTPAGKPLAVCHSASAQGSGEVSSANYEARAYGIRAGMFMGEAKSRCPHLLVVPYEFDKYQTISEQVCSGWRGAGSGTAGEGCIYWAGSCLFERHTALSEWLGWG